MFIMANTNIYLMNISRKLGEQELMGRMSLAEAHLDASPNHKIKMVAYGEGIPFAKTMIESMLLNEDWKEERKFGEIELRNQANVVTRVPTMESIISWKPGCY